MDTLYVVTATTDPERAAACLRSWALPADVPLVLVANGPRTASLATLAGLHACPARHLIRTDDYWGTVPAFRQGVAVALEAGADLVACLHDDVEIHDPQWTTRVREHFARHDRCGLAGFGGATGLGSPDLYSAPYRPHQLARRGFLSNLTDAEVHGQRTLLPRRVACLDGFSQIGRRGFFYGQRYALPLDPDDHGTVWQQMEDQGIIHHAYDSVLGALAHRLGWETWLLPVPCRHLGGQTAVGDPGYQQWAAAQVPDGDQGFWEQAHAAAYAWLHDVLPFDVEV